MNGQIFSIKQLEEQSKKENRKAFIQVWSSFLLGAVSASFIFFIFILFD